MSKSKLVAILGALSLTAAFFVAPVSEVLQVISQIVERTPVCEETREVGCFEDE